MELITVRGSLLVLALVAPLSGVAVADSMPGDNDAVSMASDTQRMVSDNQIAGILRIQNQSAMQILELVVAKAQNPKVKEFAVKAQREIKGDEKESNQLFQQQGIQAAESDSSGVLRDEGQRDLTALQQAREGAPFDQTFINLAVERHEGFLNLIDVTLLPSTKNIEVKDFLTRIREKVAMHLAAAKRLQAVVGP